LVQGNQGIGDIAKRTRNCPLVVEDHLVFGLLRKMKLPAQLSTFEKRLRQSAQAVDRFPSRREDACKAITADSTRGADRQVRKKLRTCHTNLRVGGNKASLCLLDIRAPLQQLRRQSSRKILRRWGKCIGI